jgi:C4-dicarboxylate transporter, DctM subunit
MQHGQQTIGNPEMGAPPGERGFWGGIAAGIDFLSTLVGSISGYLMLIASLIVVYETVVRTVFRSPTIWSFDITGYLMVWFGFCAAAYGIKRGSHINVDIVVMNMKARTKVPLDIISYVLSVIYSSLLFIYISKVCLAHFNRMEAAPTAWGAPVFAVELGVVIGSFLMILQSVVELARKIAVYRKGNLEKGEGILNNTALVLSVYIISLVLGVWLYVNVPSAGMVVLLAATLIAGVPVFLALGSLGMLGLFLLLGPDAGFSQAANISASALSNFVLLALPMYILAGEILMRGKIGQELFDVCFKWLGHVPGGLAVSTVAACAIFAAISGSSVATAAAIGIIALPEMLRNGYNKRLAYGVLAAGGTLGIMIPPSGPMIIFSSITDESTGALFMGGVFPGIMLSIFFAAYAAFVCYTTGQYNKVAPFSWSERIRVFKTSVWAILAPVMVIGSIYTGICTPTEAGALAVVYALIVSFARGKIKVGDLAGIMADSTRSASMILMIIVGALITGAITTLLQLPQQFTDYIMSLNMARWVVLLAIAILYVILGCFLEVVSILLITIPIMYPLILKLGYNGVWFGVWVVALMEMALITPPIGLNLFVIQGIAKTGIRDVIIGTMPFMILLLVGLVIIWAWPELVTWLPGTMGYGIGIVK